MIADRKPYPAMKDSDIDIDADELDEVLEEVEA